MIKLLFALIAIAGYIANIKDKKKLSYWLWLSSNAYWMYYNFKKEEPEMAIMFAIYLSFCIWGLNKEFNK